MLNTSEIFVFLLSLTFLLYFSFKDIKYQKIENEPIGIYILIGLMIFSLSPYLSSLALICFFWFALGSGLWYYKIIGGADVKILAIMPVYYLIGIPNIFFGAWLFLIMFGVFGTVYGLIAGQLIKKKFIPFMPLVTLTFILFWFYRLFWG